MLPNVNSINCGVFHDCWSAPQFILFDCCAHCHLHCRRQVELRRLVSTLAGADEHTVLGISTFFLHFGGKTLFYA